LIDRLLDGRTLRLLGDEMGRHPADQSRISPVNLWPNAAAGIPPLDSCLDAPKTNAMTVCPGAADFQRQQLPRRPGQLLSRNPEQDAGGNRHGVALAFMGSRTASWPPEHLNGTAVFFSQIGLQAYQRMERELVFWDPLHAASCLATWHLDRMPSACRYRLRRGHPPVAAAMIRRRRHGHPSRRHPDATSAGP